MTPELQEIAIQTAREYLQASVSINGQTPVEYEKEFDAKRAEVIESALKPLLSKYLERSIRFSDFKRTVDGINKQNKLWGFGGIKGQMFFNLLANALEELNASSELDEQIRSVIDLPKDNAAANAALRRFKAYVVEIGQRFVELGRDARSKPNPNSVPFFVSYFWQVQDRDIWPVYYTSAVQVLEGLNLWQISDDVGEDYISYKILYEDLARLYSREFGKKFSLYDVEHIFWFKSGRLIGESAGSRRPACTERVIG